MLGRRDADEGARDVQLPLAGSRAAEPRHHQGRRAADDETRERHADRERDRRAGSAWRVGWNRSPAECTGLADPLQFARQVTGTLPALVGILREAAGHDVIEQRRCQGLELGDGSRFVLENRGNQARMGRSAERPRPRDHLVEHRAERKDVGPGIAFAAFNLLRCHVLKRAENRTLCREIGGRGREGRFGGARDHQRARLRQTEVQQLRAHLREHDVAGLQIAMDDARPVGSVESRRDLDRNGERLADRDRALRQPIGERLAFEVLHDEVGCPGLFADVVQRTDMRMVELGNRAGFAIEALTRLRVGRKGRWEDLDGDGAIEPRIAGFVHLSHSTRADQRQDLVRAESGSGLQRHRVESRDYSGAISPRAARCANQSDRSLARRVIGGRRSIPREFAGVAPSSACSGVQRCDRYVDLLTAASGEPRTILFFRIHPDGRRIAIETTEPKVEI